MSNPNKDATHWTFKTKHVQGNAMVGKDYVSSESLVICAVKSPTENGGSTDPSKGSSSEQLAIAETDLFPIGIVQNVGIQQQKQINQLYELGSKEPFLIPGRTMAQIQLARVIFNGDNILAFLYNPESTGGLDENEDAGIEGANTKIYLNLASELFNKGIDIAIIVHDSEDEAVGAFIFRECYIQSHGMNISANQTIVAENISLRCKKVEGLSATF